MKIELTKEEALVLFDWLSKNEENGKCFDNDAIKCVFWSIESLLEKGLVEPFYENYSEIIEQAKESVKGKYGLNLQ